MKKLLLVMLVPVLVLGVMGCGKVYDGDTNPIALQGVWFETTGSQEVAFVVTGNQITVFKADYADTYGNIAFRTSFSGDDNKLSLGESVADQTITFYWFEGDYQEIGNIVFTFTGDGTPANDTIEVTQSNFEYTYQNVLIPPKGTYARQ